MPSVRSSMPSTKHGSVWAGTSPARQRAGADEPAEAGVDGRPRRDPPSPAGPGASTYRYGVAPVGQRGGQQLWGFVKVGGRGRDHPQKHTPERPVPNELTGHQSHSRQYSELRGAPDFSGAGREYPRRLTGL